MANPGIMNESMLAASRTLTIHLAFFAAVAAFAQNAATPPAQNITAPAETLVVLGSATPVPLAESPRPVEIFPVKLLELSTETPIDILRQDCSAGRIATARRNLSRQAARAFN
jgi:hypothetical protein